MPIRLSKTNWPSEVLTVWQLLRVTWNQMLDTSFSLAIYEFLFPKSLWRTRSSVYQRHRCRDCFLSLFVSISVSERAIIANRPDTDWWHFSRPLIGHLPISWPLIGWDPPALWSRSEPLAWIHNNLETDIMQPAGHLGWDNLDGPG